MDNELKELSREIDTLIAENSLLNIEVKNLTHFVFELLYRFGMDDNEATGLKLDLVRKVLYEKEELFSRLDSILEPHQLIQMKFDLHSHYSLLIARLEKELKK